MVLKVFTRRKKGGAYMDTPYKWKELLIEGGGVLFAPTSKGFEYLVTRTDSHGATANHNGEIDTSIQGYEVINDQGVTISRYVLAPVDAE